MGKDTHIHGISAPLTDSRYQLARLGVHAVNSDEFVGPFWEIERTADPDYPWLMTRLEDGAKRKCSALIECVMIVQAPFQERIDEICATS